MTHGRDLLLIADPIARTAARRNYRDRARVRRACSAQYGGLLKTTASDFMEDEALTHGAAIAYYTVFSIAPVLVIVIAIAGLVFGQEAAEGAIVGQLRA